MKPVQVITLGCRLNTYESEIMQQHARTAGLENTIIINTCAVTNEAERQSRQAIRRAKRDNPTARLIVTGCSAQLNAQSYAEMPEVDLVLGNVEKMKLDSFLVPEDQPQKVRVQNIHEVLETTPHLIGGFESKTRAFLEIQNGCDHRCTFCSIPLSRGPHRSVPIPLLLEQIQNFLSQGCKEVVLTGVDITGYGQDLPGQPTLSQLVRRILKHVPQLPRLRLSSLDPAEVDAEFFTLLATEPRLMPHIHISLQAGHDLILKRMKRRHLSQDVRDFCAQIAQVRPDCVLGADVIAGFPTESEEMFQATLQILDQCGISYIHAFPFSPRQGTPAARMPQVSKAVVKERAARLRELAAHQKDKFFQRCVGQTLPALFEAGEKAHTPHFAPLILEKPMGIPLGEIHPVTIIGYTEATLIGQLA